MNVIESSPYSVSSQNATREKHAKIHRGSLNHSANGHDHTHQLHESNTSELIANEGLCQGTTSLTGDVDSNDLEILVTANASWIALAYRTRETLGGVVHILDPAFMGDSCAQSLA